MATPNKPMCCVMVGYQALLMPADKGMKLVELLQYAVECEHGWGDRDHTYTVGEQPRVEYRMVKPGQIRSPGGGVELDAAPARRTGASRPRLLK